MALEVAFSLGIGFQEEAVVETHFGLDGMFCADPMDGSFDFAVRGCAAALAVEICCAAEFQDSAGCIFDHLIAPDDIRILETDLATGSQAEILRRRIFHEIAIFNVKLTAEGNFASTGV